MDTAREAKIRQQVVELKKRIIFDKHTTSMDNSSKIFERYSPFGFAGAQQDDPLGEINLLNNPSSIRVLVMKKLIFDILFSDVQNCWFYSICLKSGGFMVSKSIGFQYTG